MSGEPPARNAGLWATLFVGIATGLVDAILTLARSPDPGLASYRLGYFIGPLLVEAGWAIGVGFATRAAWRVVFSSSGSVSVGAVAAGATWGAGLLVTAMEVNRSPWAIAVLIAGLTLAVVALVRVALDAGRSVSRLRGRTRAAVSVSLGLIAVAALLGSSPATIDSFGGGTGRCATDGDSDGEVPTRPNILLVSIDALRSDVARTMRSYQRLAACGDEYRQHITSAPWTLPSIASLLTGLPPESHRGGRSLSTRSLIARSAIRPDAVMLAETLGASGYRTQAIVTNPFLTRRYGFDRGFCGFENVTMQGEAMRGLSQTTPVRVLRVLAPSLLPSDRADAVRRRAESWLETDSESSQPFFLWLHFLDPHAPFGDRDGESTSLTLDLMAFQDRAATKAPFRAMGQLRAGEYRPSSGERAEIEALYREDVSYVDGELVALLDFLDRSGLAKGTAIVLTSDHGEEFWDHGGAEHGRSLYDEILQVPLLVIPAGECRSGDIHTEMTTVLDVAPTVLGLAGIASTSEGMNLVGGTHRPGRTLLLGNVLFGEELWGVRTSDYKYIRSEGGEEQLFGLYTDPKERINIIALRPEQVSQARTLLWATDGLISREAIRLDSVSP